MKPDPILAILNFVYSVLLRLYPSQYRQEFADEMQEVFSQAVIDASRDGPLSLGSLLAGELVDFPGAAVRAYLHRKDAKPSLAARSWSKNALSSSPGELSWRELLLVLAVFLLPAGMLLFSQSSQPVAASGLNAALLFLAIMVIAGILRGAPLRSLPYFGVILAIAGYLFLFQWVVGMVSPTLITNFSTGPWDYNTYILLKIFSNGILWLMLFCLTLLVIALLALFNRFQPLFRRTDHDWTLLSYILYGESVFALLFLFESYRYEPSYAVASLLCLAAGGWFYLRSHQPRRRILALIGGLTLALWVTALGAWLTYPGARGSLSAVLNTSAAVSGRETGRVLLVWILMVVILLLPGLLARLPLKSRLRGSQTQFSN